MRAVWFGIAVLAGCASAGKDDTGFTGGHVDAPIGNPQKDAPNQQQIDGAITQHDAPMQSIDAPPSVNEKTITETSNTTIAAAESLACGNSDNTTALNSYYRTFATGVTTPFTVEHVDFAAQESDGSATVQIFIGTFSGTLGSATITSGQMTSLGNATVTVPPTTTGEPLIANFTNVTIPGGSNMYVEILSPDDNGTGKYFYVGMSSGGQTADGYISAAGCQITNIEKLATAAAGAGVAAGSLILSVTGTY